MIQTLFVLFILLLIHSYSASANYSNESELGIIVTGGNTVQETWNTKTLNRYQHRRHVYKLGGHYTYGKANDELSARNYDAWLRYEFQLSSLWSLFTSIQHEADYFASLEYRWNYDLGGLYQIIKSENQTWQAEIGYRRSLESDFSGRKTSQTKLRLYSKYQLTIREGFSVFIWLEGLPNLSESRDWQLQLSPGLNLALIKTLALKLTYLYKYDNAPATGASQTDYQYITSLNLTF